MRARKLSVFLLIIVFNIIAFMLLAVSKGKLDKNALIFGSSVVVALIVFQLVSIIFMRNGDYAIISAVSFLVSIGMIIQYRLDGMTAFKHLLAFAAGLMLYLFSFLIVRYYYYLEKYYFLYGLLSLAMLAITLVIGKDIYGARNWIVIGGNSIQPSEFVKLSLVFFMASTLNTKRSFFRLIFPIAVVVMCICLLVLQKDLGSSLLIFLVTISMVFLSTSNFIYVILGFGFASIGAYASYFLFSHVRVRVEAWANPWKDVAGNGYQLAQALFAIAAGGWLGTGLKLGHPYLVPIVESDFVFAAVCEEFGAIMGLLVIFILLLIAYRGFKIAREASDVFYGLLSAGCSLTLAFQTFIIIGGVIKFIPLTGITLPFVSYGGTSMVVNLAIMGILQGIYINNSVQEKDAVDEIEG